MSSSERNTARSAIFNGSQSFKRVPAKINGVDIELVQPSVGFILDQPSATDPEIAKNNSLRMLIQCCVLPGTEERVFEDTDMDLLRGMPYDADMIVTTQALTKLLSVNSEDAAKN